MADTEWLRNRKRTVADYKPSQYVVDPKGPSHI